MIRRSVIFCCLSVFTLSNNNGIAQNMLPGKIVIMRHKISEVIVNNYSVINKKNIKKYTDTVKFDTNGYLVEKWVTAYDTDSERKFSGDWKYTYDSVGNRLLETRKSSGERVMDYFIYTYDSSRMKQKIWNYWVNLKLSFSRIYEMNYDSKGRLETALIEDGGEKIDSSYIYRYDTLNRLKSILCSLNKNFKDTDHTINYTYTKDGKLAAKTIRSKASRQKETFTYNENKQLIKVENGNEITSYEYDINGLLTMSEVEYKGKKGMKLKYTYYYLFYR